MGLGIDIGVDAQPDGQWTAKLPRNTLHDVELLNVFHVQSSNAGLRGCEDLLTPLADPAVHDALGREPRIEGALHFTDRDDVRTAALRREPREH